MRRLTVLALVLAVAMSSWRAAGAEPRDQLVVQVERVAALIARLLGSARRAHDAAAIACLDDKLSRTHAALGEVRGHATPGNARAPAALPAGDARRIGRVRRAIRARVRDLEREAETCGSGDAGGEVLMVEVRTSVDPAIPADDPSVLGDPAFQVDRPVWSSGFY